MHEAFDHPAVVRQVVATDEREPTRAHSAACGKPRHHDADRRFRCVGMREVVRNVGMALVQRASRRIVAIALLRDCRRHDRDARIFEPRDERGA